MMILAGEWRDTVKQTQRLRKRGDGMTDSPRHPRSYHRVFLLLPCVHNDAAAANRLVETVVIDAVLYTGSFPPDLDAEGVR